MRLHRIRIFETPSKNSMWKQTVKFNALPKQINFSFDNLNTAKKRHFFIFTPPTAKIFCVKIA